MSTTNRAACRAGGNGADLGMSLGMSDISDISLLPVLRHWRLDALLTTLQSHRKKL